MARGELTVVLMAGLKYGDCFEIEVKILRWEVQVQGTEGNHEEIVWGKT